MKAHELAKHLLEQPDYPVIMNGWGSDEGVDVEVIGSTIINRTKQTDEGPIEINELHLKHEEVQW